MIARWMRLSTQELPLHTRYGKVLETDGKMAGDNGFEPLLPVPETGGLPLAESPTHVQC